MPSIQSAVRSFSPRPTPLAAQQPPGDIERRGQAGQGEAKAGVVDDLQRPAVEEFIGIGADPAHQRQRVAIGAEQDVLAVVELAAIDLDALSPPTEHTAGFEQRRFSTSRSQFDSGGNARPAATNDGYAHPFSP